MAVNLVSKKRNTMKSYKNCPKPLLNVVPQNCSKITFSELLPGESYENKAVIGKISHLYPVGKRMGGYVRKIVITDALDECENSQRTLIVFLIDRFAKDSDSAEVEGFIIITNFIVEKLTHQSSKDMSVQILVKSENSQVWFGRKINKRGRKTSVSPHNGRKKQKVDEPTDDDDDDEPQAVLTHHYEYTKLGDLVESEAKESYNVYGIVDKCDLKITQGKKLNILDLLLTDQTETGFSCTVFAPLGETFPNVYPGDIVRIHRMQIYKFRGRLKGRCPNPKFILVFSKDNEGDKPRTVAKTFTFTPEDIARFKDLFEWNKTKNDPKLISEIKRDNFVNLICQVIGVYVARTTEAVILKIWDGTKTNEFPGVHWGMKEEKLDHRLFTVARNYYVVLSVYGHHTAVAAELEPGQYIDVRDAHLYSPKDNPDDMKLCLHAGNKEGRGIIILSEDDDRVIQMKQRLEKVISDTLEYGNQTEDLLSENNSIFLNCDISVLTSTQKTNNVETPASDVVPDDVADHSEEIQGAQVEKDVEILNDPLSQNDESRQNRVVSVVDAAIKPGQSTQEFGLGMPRDHVTTDDENRPSVASEPDPACNLTPLETRYFFHDPLRLSSQMNDSIFPTYTTATQDEWWNSIPTLSVTDGHSNIKPTSLAEIDQHAVPYKFRVFVAMLSFKPHTSSIEKFIRLSCPKCFFISEDAYPDFEAFEAREGLSYYFCPECSDKETDQSQWPVLEYTFLMSISLHDGSGPPSVEAYLWKENAIKFFKGITPEEALRDSGIADSILHMLWNICPNCKPLDSSSVGTTSVYPILDCCILSYIAVNQTRYQVFNTMLV